VQRVDLRGPEGLAIQIDGDALPIQLPVSVTVHRERIQILRPIQG